MHSAVSRPPEARRKVLGSTNHSSSPTTSASFSASRPIRARVDLGNVSPQAGSSTWTPSQPVRARVQTSSASRGGAFASAPSTPSATESPFARGGGGGTPVSSVHGGVRATLSPHTPSAGRAPSPVRARSPEGAAVRPTVARVGTTARVVRSDLTPEPKLLRGQTDPFPSPASSSNTATPISYLPSSVSVRRLPSPRARASSGLGASTSTSSSVDSSAPVPALSTSPNSAASSPLASPNLPAHAFDHAGLYPAPHAYYDGSVGRKGPPNVRRSSGGSSVSTTSAHGVLLPPISIASAERLVPPMLSPAMASFPQSPPLRSPSLQSVPIRATPTPGAVRSPTISSFSSVRTVKVATSVPSSTRSSRPPSAASNPANRYRHARSQSTTSNSSLSSAFSPDEHPAPPDPPATWNGVRSPVGSPVHSGARGVLAGVDWSTVAQLAELDVDHLGDRERSLAAGRVSSGSEGPLSGSSVDGRNEVDEAEKEARVVRKIADLEIRNTSLLAINATLERLKVKHTTEIRELRRRMRESIGGAGLAALRAQVSRLDEGDGSDAGSESEGAGDAEGDDGREPTWQELLEGDATFSALAATVEGLVARGRRAIEYEPSKGEAGRVLTAVEMEDRLQDGSDGVDDEDDLTPESSGQSTPATSVRSGEKGRFTERGLGIAGWQNSRR